MGCLYTHNIYNTRTNIYGNIIKHNDALQWSNTLLYKKISLLHFILERIDVSCVLEVSGDKDGLLFWPKVLLTIAALLSHSDWAAQPWVTEGPNPSVCLWPSRWHLVPNWLQLTLELTEAVCGTWLYNCLMPTCFRCSSNYLHRCISSVEGQHTTGPLTVDITLLYFPILHCHAFMHRG